MANAMGSRRRWGRLGIVGAVAIVLIVAVLLMTGGDDEPETAGRTGADAGEVGSDDDGPSSTDEVDDESTDAAAEGDDVTDATDGDATDGAEASPNDPNAPPVDPNEGPNDTVPRDPSKPVGDAANPAPVGTAATMGGWRITLTSPGGAGEAVTAHVKLEWQGREGVSTGDPGELVLRISDGTGNDRILGGSACPAGSDGAVGSLADVAVGAATEVDLCWTVPAGDRAAMAMIVESIQLAETSYHAIT